MGSIFKCLFQKVCGQYVEVLLIFMCWFCTLQLYWIPWLVVNSFNQVLRVSVQFSCSVVSDSLWPHELQHTRPPCVCHQLQEFTQTHIHRVSDAIQPSHPLLSPSPLAPNPSQHQSLFQWVNSSHEVAKVSEVRKELMFLAIKNIIT